MIQVELLTPQVNTLGLVAQYKLYAGLTSASKVFDYSLSGNDGTVTGTSIIPAYPGFDLAGNDEYFNAGSAIGTAFVGSFTLCAWIKLDDGDAGDMIMGVQSGTSFIHFNITTAGKVIVRYSSDGNSGQHAQTDAAVFGNGQTDWTNIITVCDSTVNGVGGKVIYVNGVLQTLDGTLNGTTLNVVFADFNAAGEDVFIGALNNSGAGSFLGGLIDEPMIFTATKTAAEIKSIFEVTRSRYGV